MAGTKRIKIQECYSISIIYHSGCFHLQTNTEEPGVAGSSTVARRRWITADGDGLHDKEVCAIDARQVRTKPHDSQQDICASTLAAYQWWLHDSILNYFMFSPGWVVANYPLEELRQASGPTTVDYKASICVSALTSTHQAWCSSSRTAPFSPFPLPRRGPCS